MGLDASSCGSTCAFVVQLGDALFPRSDSDSCHCRNVAHNRRESTDRHLRNDVSRDSGIDEIEFYVNRSQR